MAARYTLTLGQKLDDDLTYIALDLGVSKSEAIRRAIRLLCEAARVDEVRLYYTDGTIQQVRIK